MNSQRSREALKQLLTKVVQTVEAIVREEARDFRSQPGSSLDTLLDSMLSNAPQQSQLSTPDISGSIELGDAGEEYEGAVEAPPPSRRRPLRRRPGPANRTPQPNPDLTEELNTLHRRHRMPNTEGPVIG